MSKSRGERSGKTPSGSQAASNNTQNAVVPGKFMETDWYVYQFFGTLSFFMDSINSKYRKCQILTSFSLFSFKVIFKFSLNFDIFMSGKNWILYLGCLCVMEIPNVLEMTWYFFFVLEYALTYGILGGFVLKMTWNFLCNYVSLQTYFSKNIVEEVSLFSN